MPGKGPGAALIGIEEDLAASTLAAALASASEVGKAVNGDGGQKGVKSGPLVTTLVMPLLRVDEGGRGVFRLHARLRLVT